MLGNQCDDETCRKLGAGPPNSRIRNNVQNRIDYHLGNQTECDQNWLCASRERTIEAGFKFQQEKKNT